MRYCSEACSRAHWRVQDGGCRLLRLVVWTPGRPARLALQAVTRPDYPLNNPASSNSHRVCILDCPLSVCWCASLPHCLLHVVPCPTILDGTPLAPRANQCFQVPLMLHCTLLLSCPSQLWYGSSVVARWRAKGEG